VNIIIDDSDTQDNIRQKLQTQLLAGSTEGLPDIVLIQDDQAKKYLLSFPGAFEPLSDSIDMSQFPSTRALPASSIAPTISRKRGSPPRTCRTSPGTS
jgi:lactose/L-arabinose transport system substrate-binding protein